MNSYEEQISSIAEKRQHLANLKETEKDENVLQRIAELEQDLDEEEKVANDREFDDSHVEVEPEDSSDPTAPARELIDSLFSEEGTTVPSGRESLTEPLRSKGKFPRVAPALFYGLMLLVVVTGFGVYFINNPPF